jgi:hypothetical protein
MQKVYNVRLTRLIIIAPLLVAVLTMIGATTPYVYARHLSDTQRYNDGYSNGGQAAATDSTYNPICDPNGQYTSDGQHSTTYCTGWANGYTATWNANHGVQRTQQYTGGPVYPQPQHPSLTTQAYNACVQHLGICTAVLKVAACSLFGLCL